MTHDQARKMSDQALQRLSDDLSRGHSDTLKNYLAVMARFRKYSWNNCLLIYSQRPEASHVAGFHTWRKLGHHVLKGEKGILILAPMVGRIKNDELTEDQETLLYGFRIAHVFDFSQTEGAPLPDFATVKGDPRSHADSLVQFIAEQSIVLDYDGRIAPAKGISFGGKITLLPDLSPAEHLAVLVHELAHEMLHRGERRLQTTKTLRESEAEAVAYVVCEAVGLDTNTASADYIHLYNGDCATLAASLALIQQTAAEIIEAIAVAD